MCTKRKKQSYSSLLFTLISRVVWLWGRPHITSFSFKTRMFMPPLSNFRFHHGLVKVITPTVTILKLLLPLKAFPMLSDVTGGGKRTKVTKLSRYTCQDLIALFTPHLVTVAVMAGMSCCVYAPSMSVWFYSSLPGKYRSPIWFAVCLAMEAHCFTFVAINGSSLLQIHVVFFDRINRNLQAVATSVTSM